MLGITPLLVEPILKFFLLKSNLINKTLLLTVLFALIFLIAHLFFAGIVFYPTIVYGYKVSAYVNIMLISFILAFSYYLISFLAEK